MAKHRERQKVEVVRLGFEFTFVTEFDNRGKPKAYTTAPAGSALVIKGEGRDQEITWMPWDEAMTRYEPEDEIGHDDEDAPRAAARRRDRITRYDDRRDGHREPRYDEHPRYRDGFGLYAPGHALPSEPYRMPTLLPNAVLPSDDEQKRRAESM